MKWINYKKKLHKRSKTEKDLKLRNNSANEHKILKRNLRKEIQLGKDRYYQKFFKENKNNLIKVWKNIKNFINFNPKASNNNIKKIVHWWRKISSNPLEISNFLSKHFTTVAAKIENKIIKTNKNFSF